MTETKIENAEPFCVHIWVRSREIPEPTYAMTADRTLMVCSNCLGLLVRA